MNLSRWITISLLTIGCASHETQQPVSANSAPTTSAPPPAIAAAPKQLPPELAALAPKAVIEAGPFAWPKGGTSAIIDDTAAGKAKVVWHTAAAHGEIALPGTAASAVVEDITKNGTSELVIFAKPPAEAPQWFADLTMTWIVGVEPKTKTPARMWRLENEVMGATDQVSLDRELGTVGTFATSTSASPIRTIARLHDATPDELKALVGPAGLKLCTRHGEKRSCKTIARSALDSKRTKQVEDRGGLISAFDFNNLGNEEPSGGLEPPNCDIDDKNPARLQCISSVGGPEGSEWIFFKTDAGLQLAEVWTWAEDS